MRHLRIHLGNVSERDGVGDVMEVIRQAFKEDRIGWYSIEESDSTDTTHPRYHAHIYTEIEGDE